MKSEADRHSSSPPTKKLRTADFGSILQRSHSITEEYLEMTEAFKDKVINDS